MIWMNIMETCKVCNGIGDNLIDLFDEFQTNTFLKRIFDRIVGDKSLDVDVYMAIARKLTDGVYEGFGKDLIKTQWGTPDYRMLESLRKNVYIFSAAKTYQQTKEITKLLYTDKGIKPFNQFIDDAKPIFETYNKQYLSVEYNSAIMQARSAAQWMEIENDIDIYEQLEYHTVGDARVRREHAILNGTIRPVNDKFWSVFMPPNGWNCFDDKTSIYTNNGWKLFSELEPTDLVYTLNPETKIPEFQKPINYIKQKHNGKLISIKASNFSSMTTPEHKMLVKKGWDSKMKRDVLKLIDAKNVSTGDQIYKSSNWIGTNVEYIQIGDKKIDIKTYVKFMGWYLSEGSTTKRSDNSYQIKISQSPKKHLDLIAEDLFDMPYSVYKGADYVGINNTELGKYLIEFGYSFEKYVPDNIKSLTPELISLFLDRYIKGDGHTHTNSTIGGYDRKNTEMVFTSSKRMCGDLTELIIKIGKSSNVRHIPKTNQPIKHRNGYYTSNHDIYRINISHNQYFNVSKKKHITEIDYDGFVYCVEVPLYNTLLVMNNGKISWSGNCRCTVLQASGEKNTDLRTLKVSKEDVPEIFRFNPGISKQIYSPKHPYFKVAKQDKEFAKENFGLPLPRL